MWAKMDCHIQNRVPTPWIGPQRGIAGWPPCRDSGFQGNKAPAAMSHSGAQGSIGSRSTSIAVRTYKICLFEKENFQGRHLELKGECKNLCEKGLDRVGSISVDCGP
ncbi:hypothetical protein JZ751_009366 [Albula glossodonta]|uniref:Beta/gamma crystallin 'Greek key' domain-containing protein n=1 Tax=Albula glossodonta TaxID=121402 RepID=A0A8T2N8E6_9TELE|nr:hypothetical protein JZ751_009366 [Albula glossodonta]